MKHSKYGASSMYRWSACPGSVEHMENNPMPSSDFANEGTQAHDAAEWYLSAELGLDIDGDEPQISEEMKKHVDFYVDYCEKLCESMGDGVCFAVEQRFQLKGVHSEAFGTNDFSCWQDFDHLHIVDLKYGVGIEIQAEENKQLMYYALGCVLENDLDVDKITVHVVQPRIDDPVKTWTFDYKRLMEFREEVLNSIAKVEVDYDKRIPGEHCRFCNKAQCSEFIKHMQAETTLDVTDAISLKSTEVLSVDQLAKIIKAESQVTAFLKDAKVLYQDMAERGIVDPADHGMKLVESRGNTKFKDSDIPYRKLGLKKDQVFESKPKTATQIKKLVPKDKLELFGELTERPLRGYKLVSTKAKGEPVKSLVEDTLKLN